MGMITHIQQVMNTVSSGMLVEDADRNILMVNQRFLDIFGVPDAPDTLCGLNCLQLADTAKDFFKDPEQFKEDIANIPETGEEQKDLVATADGRYFHRKYSPIYDGTELCCHVWNYEEVTTLKHKDEELLEQKEFFHKVLNELPADIAIFSAGHKYMYLNKTAIKNEKVRNWLIGKDDYDYCKLREMDMSVADSRREKFNRAKETRAAVSWVDERIKDDGTIDYVLRIFYPYINGKDEIEFVIGYGVNITKQKEHELLIAQEKERFRTLIDTLNDGVFQITYDGEIQFYNHSFLKAMAIKEEDMPTQYNRSVMRSVLPEDKSSLYTAFDRVQATHEPQSGLFRVVNEFTGEISYIDYHIWHRHTESDGDVVAGRLSDVTEREMRVKSMQTVVTKEKELNSLKSHFIHITSHELRTPLSVIMSSAEILEMCEDDGGSVAELMDTRSLTTGIVREVNRIADILDELLLVGRIESGKIKFDPQFTDIREYIDGITEEMFLPYKDGRMLEVNIADGLMPAFIDHSLMRHAIANLLVNAFKYSQGKRSPQLNIFEWDNQLHIQVKDFGIGIPEEEKNNLFSSFYRASNVGNISGTGIGLMVVEHVIKTHKGTINVESKQGEGSVFTLSLPMVQNL